jgi:hypothetical protein
MVNDCGLQPEEFALVYDVTERGVLAYLIRGREPGTHELARAELLSVTRQELQNRVKAFLDMVIIDPVALSSSRERIAHLEAYVPQGPPRELFDLLLGPFLPDIPEQARLIIVPDDCLRDIPFGALVYRDGVSIEPVDSFLWGPQTPLVKGDAFLGVRNRICYEQSMTALAAARANQKSLPAGNKTLLVLDPVLDRDDGRLGWFGNVHKEKREQIERILDQQQQVLARRKQSRSGHCPRFRRAAGTGNLTALEGVLNGETRVMAGIDANEAALRAMSKDELTGFRYVVFGSHGFFDPSCEDIQEPIIALTPTPDYPYPKNHLTMSDATELSVNADVAVLAACQTGRGRLAAGEGSMNMGRAFQIAGARSVLVTLWPVRGDVTVMFITSFMRHVDQTGDKVDALRAARQTLRKNGFSHPHFWAPYVLVGEP